MMDLSFYCHKGEEIARDDNANVMACSSPFQPVDYPICDPALKIYYSNSARDTLHTLPPLHTDLSPCTRQLFIIQDLSNAFFTNARSSIIHRSDVGTQSERYAGNLVLMPTKPSCQMDVFLRVVALPLSPTTDAGLNYHYIFQSFLSFVPKSLDASTAIITRPSRICQQKLQVFFMLLRICSCICFSQRLY